MLKHPILQSGWLREQNTSPNYLPQLVYDGSLLFLNFLVYATLRRPPGKGQSDRSFVSENCQTTLSATPERGWPNQMQIAGVPFRLQSQRCGVSRLRIVDKATAPGLRMSTTRLPCLFAICALPPGRTLFRPGWGLPNCMPVLRFARTFRGLDQINTRGSARTRISNRSVLERPRDVPRDKCHRRKRQAKLFCEKARKSS